METAPLIVHRCHCRWCQRESGASFALNAMLEVDRVTSLGAGSLMRFVRVGTLDEPDRLPPDIHIFTSAKQPWVILPPGTPALRPDRFR
ncbi:MAG: GFA family protein [Steroidobacteraceae bacterium]